MKCKYCGCDEEDHPEMSDPLGSFTCVGCQECYLISGDVKKLNEGN